MHNHNASSFIFSSIMSGRVTMVQYLMCRGIDMNWYATSLTEHNVNSFLPVICGLYNRFPWLVEGFHVSILSI
jgi:hypothetical protein